MQFANKEDSNWPDVKSSTELSPTGRCNKQGREIQGQGQVFLKSLG